MLNHLHILLALSPKHSASAFIECLKGNLALMMFDGHVNLKYKFGNRHFWAEEFYVRTVGLNKATMRHWQH